MGKTARPSGNARLTQWLFWSNGLAILYTWLAYPVLLKALVRVRQTQRAEHETADWPSASIVLVCHNEEDVIIEALEDLLALDYPPDKVEIVVVSDGSWDHTEELVRSCKDERVRLVSVLRSGLTAGVEQGVKHARHEIIVRSDADTRHASNYLRLVLRHFRDPRVGCVGASFSFANLGETGITRNEGLYWRYEMSLRKAESDLGVLSTTSGAAMSFRKALFEPFSPQYSDDIVIPKLVVKNGYRVVQEPDAIAYELMPQSIVGEFRSRERMVARGLAGLLSREGMLNPLQYPGHFVSIVSHKLLRWATPIFMLGSFVSALGLARRPAYRLAALGHIALYSSATLGYLLERRRWNIRFFSATFSFCLANIGFLVGLVQALRGRRIMVYQSQQ